jgi:hypothetical protein
VGFGGPPCNAVNLAPYLARIPAAVMYHGVAAAKLPAGFPVAGAIGPNGNDWVIDLYKIVHVLETSRSPAFV